MFGMMILITDRAAQVKEEMDNREKVEFLESLENSIKKSARHLNQILEWCGWEKDVLMGAPDLHQCQIDGNHFVPESKDSRHNKYCELRRQNLTREEAKELLEQNIYKRTAAGRLVFNADDIAQLLPKERSTSVACPQPPDLHLHPPKVRLAVYDKVVAKTRQTKQVESKVNDELFFLDRKGWEKKKEESDNKRKSFVEQLAEKRDLRRRRQTYRAKNVHITSKSHTEIIREVINNQMEVLERIIQDEEADRPVSAPSVCGSHDGGSRGGGSHDGSFREGGSHDSGSREDGTHVDGSREGGSHDRGSREGRSRENGSRDRGARERSHEWGSREVDEKRNRRDDHEGSRHKKHSHKRKRSLSRSRDKGPSGDTESHHKRHKKHKYKDREEARDDPAD